MRMAFAILFCFSGQAWSAFSGGNPVADWHFDELSWDGSSDEVVDSSSNGYHGQSYSATTASGKVCQAADLSATSSTDRVVLDYRALDNRQDITISAWVKTGATSDLVLLSGANSSEDNEFTAWFASGDDFWPIVRGNDDEREIIPDIADSQWHHFVWVRDYSGGSRVYIDGNYEGYWYTSSGAIDIDPGGLILGQEQDSLGGSFLSSESWRGLVDEMVIFDYELTATDISSIYTNQNAGNNWDGSTRSCPAAPDATLIAHYGFEDDWDISGQPEDSVGSVDGVQTSSVAKVDAPAADNKPNTCSAAGFNGGAFHLDGLPVSTSSGDKTSVSFWMKWDGSTNVMPFGWYAYDLWFPNSSQFGFNSFNSDIHGITPSSVVLDDHWRHVVAVFNNGGGSANKLYIDGVDQTFTVDSNSYSSSNVVAAANAAIGGVRNTSSYRYTGLIDELKIYNGEMTQAQVTAEYGTTPACAIPADTTCGIGGTDELIFSDDFSDGDFDGWSATSFNGNSCGWSVSGEQLGESSDSCRGFMGHDLSAEGIDATSTTDYTLKVDIDPASSGTSNNSVGLVFGYQDSSNYYMVQWEDYASNYAGYSTYRDFKLVKVSNGSTTILDVIDDVDLPSTFALTVSVDASNGIQVYVDCEASSYRLSAASEQPPIYEFGVHTDDNDNGVYYDNIEVYALNAPLIAPTLVGDWHFDELSWSGSSADVLDSSGTGNHGTAQSGASTTSYGQVCGAGVFDGADDYVQIPNHSSLQVTGSMTLSAWVYPEDLSEGRQGIIFKHYNSEYELIMEPSGKTSFYHGDGSYEEITEPASATVTQGQWNHVVITRDAAAKLIRFYIDGAYVGQDSYVKTPVASSNSVNIGRRIIGTEAFKGKIDEVRIYDGRLSDTDVSTLYTNQNAGNNADGSVRSCPAAIDHIRFIHDGAAMTCAPESIRVQACADSSCATLVSSDVTLNLTPSGWIGGDTKVLTAGDQTYQLKKTSAGDVTLGVSSTDPSAASSPVCVVNGVAGSCTVTFSAAGFAMDVPDLTAGKPSVNVALSASSGGVSCGADFSGARNVYFWSDYESPSTGTLSVTVNGTEIGTASPGTLIALTFDSSGQTNLVVTYPDAGDMTLYANYDGSAGGEPILAGNDGFVSRPVALVLSSPDSNAVASSSSAAAGKFTRAGDDFNMNLKAVRWTSDADTDLSDNAVTPNFVLASIPISHSLTAPTGAGTSAGTIATASVAMTDGDLDFTQSVSEVGIFTFSATPPAYFGVVLPVATTEPLGRFSAASFSVSLSNTPALAPVCSSSTSFSYLDQWVNYSVAPAFTITAKNASGVTTSNYDDTFWKLNSAMANRTYSDTATAPSEGALYAFAWDTSVGGSYITGLDTFDGSAEVTLETSAVAGSSDRFAYERSSTPISSFSAGVDLSIPAGDLTDADGACYLKDGADQVCDALTVSDITGTEMRFGRVTLKGGLGSAEQSLALTLQSEYMDAGQFVRNIDDNCTNLGLSPLSFNNWTENLQAGDTALSSINAPFSNGEGDLILTAPGKGVGADTNDGGVDVIVTVPVWLQYNWNGIDDNGDLNSNDDMPQARAVFGLFNIPNGSGNQIYIQERY